MSLLRSSARPRKRWASVSEVARLREQVQRQEAELALLEEFGRQLVGAGTAREVAQILAGHAKALLDCASLVVFQQQAGELHPLLVDSPSAARLQNASLLGLEEPILAESWRRRSALQRTVPAEAEDRVFSGESAVATFLLGDVGLLYAGARREFPASATRLVAALARQAGLALLSVESLSSLRQAIERQEEAYLRLQESELELVWTGKMAAVGQLAAGVAHELNTPLATILLEVEGLALDLAEDVEAGESLEKITAELLRAQEIVGSLLYYARDAGVGVKIFELNKVIQESVALVGSQLRQSGSVIELDLAPGPLNFRGNGNEIQQVLLNLLLNAKDAVEGAPSARVTVKTWRESDRLLMSVSDNGGGVDAEVAQRIFDPFFTTKPVGRGTGLGLSISRRLAERHQGFLELTSTAVGACFVLGLPGYGGGTDDQ